MPITPTVEQILEMVRLRHGKAVGARSAIIKPLVEYWGKYIIPAHIADTPRMASHFLSQIVHETGHFKTLTEYASGEAYNGRKDLGNIHPGDGPAFKGRGYLQLTGRNGYKYIGDQIGVDLENSPWLAAQPETAVRCAAAIWKWKGLISSLSDGDDPSDVEVVTRRINGGMNGYADRLAYYRAARRIWRDDPVEPPAPEPPSEGRLEALIAELKALTGAKDVSLIYD